MEENYSSANDIREFKFPKLKQDGNLTTLDFFQRITHSLTDILSKISIRVKTKFDNRYQVFSLYDPSMYTNAKNYSNEMYTPLIEDKFIDQNYLPFGRCFTFHTPKWLKILQVCISFFKDLLQVHKYLCT